MAAGIASKAEILVTDRFGQLVDWIVISFGKHIRPPLDILFGNSVSKPLLSPNSGFAVRLKMLTIGFVINSGKRSLR